jgi:predicted AlkP superfamily pyrophosphatase or phosphodiesterase
MTKNMKKVSLFVFMDAFGWELLKRHPFLDDLLVTKVPLGTIFGYSSTCDPTIITGKVPRDHGHFSFFVFNPAESPFGICRYLAVLPKFLTRRGRVRRVLSRVIQRYYGYTGYFQIYNMPFRYLPLFDYSEKRDLYQPGGINSGVPTIFDHLRDQGIPFYLSDWRIKEEDNLKSLESALEEGEIVFAYLYMAAMDAILHAHGTKSPLVTDKIKWYENKLRSVITLAQKKYDPVHVYLFTDHGMTDITDECDLIKQIDRLGLRFGIDYAAMYDSTMARFWFHSNSAREKIIEVLEKEPQGQILSEERLREYGCDFPDNKYGDLFFLMNPGVLMLPSFMGETSLAGMHGYAPEHKDSLAMLASNVVPDPMPQRLDDLYDLMLGEVSDSG